MMAVFMLTTSLACLHSAQVDRHFSPIICSQEPQVGIHGVRELAGLPLRKGIKLALTNGDGVLDHRVSFSNLVYRDRGSGWHIVGTISDLSGKVRIKSAADAIQFVRIRTSPTTMRLWQDGYKQELICENSISSDLLLGVTIKEQGSGIQFPGIVRTPKLCAITRTYPRTSKTAKGFEVTRLILEAQRPGDMTLFEETEAVGLAGEYRLVRKVRIQSGPLATLHVWLYTLH